MQGLETALVRLAVTALSTLARSVVTPQPGAGLVTGRVRPLPKPASPERLARVLSGRIKGSYARLPENERLAAVAAVRDAFAAAGTLDAERLFAVDLEPRRLAAEIRRPVPDLTEEAQGLYAALLELCCAHLIEQLTAHPSFAARAAVEQTRRTGELLRERQPAAASAASDFERRYAGFLAETHSRLELFGVTLAGRTRAEWSLDTAYLSLAVSGDRPHGPQAEEDGLPGGAAQPAVRVEQALAGGHRLMLRGAAGSGKSTLVQWLALNAARQSFGPELADWNRCVPFVLRLRSFRLPEALPMPEDFLTTSGVPLRAPEGWVQDMLDSGRALVLVDGVDEVPAKLRNRTESWLRSLIAAFPHARYVVTTRPSAVPEDWPPGQGFTAYTLLPMERDEVRAFIAHWHDTARRECAAPGEQDVLHRYESGLVEAVTTRRDLGRLATNPLMCALLCALHRDRRMHLPRARKELYDAALDLLLIRRDTEREVTSVEGVSLSRDEQTALLQRLAYWMIRNGQAEADRQDAVAMLDEWLAAMPQVRAQGDAEQVFTHLLIRSGLLREPVPGSVGFVHRTFQDYLGAKAAVEARDFGVLVRNAHDDQWDDVVRMAVGHARVEERTRLLRQLLRRAEKVRRHRERLVLLAAASLEHAPELEPEVRREVEERTGELMPPETFAQVESLAKAGQLVLELLPGPEGLTDRQAAAVVRTAERVGGDAALTVISRFRSDQRPLTRSALGNAWSAFDTREYFEAVLEGNVGGDQVVPITRTEQLAFLTRLPELTDLNLLGDHGLPDMVLEHLPMKFLLFWENPSLIDLSGLRRLPHLEALSLSRCPSVTDLRALSGLRLRDVFLYSPSVPMSLTPLADMPELRHLVFDFAPVEKALDDLPFAPQLTGLGFLQQASRMRLSGLEALTSLRWLTVNEDHQWRALLSAGAFSPLSTLQILDVPHVDLSALVAHRQLASLYLRLAHQVDGITALAELPLLESVRFADCGPLDLTPLAHLENVTVTLHNCPQVTGLDLFPPERLFIE
ncbi:MULTISPECIES: NACHT domain-containing protein [Streptomyces]|uniref:NACHT domain-containing protein n=1 Tax=Streptomyces TaxID=1883 RepID=UPI001E5D2C5A|nr:MULTISPECIES: NACHT domain-containing protein [Streptomyces]UFQ18142.1 NACHT domain-containing protein [Streptomyces huasconensis]WCL87753.1 NACHT domain-containing protein [Streptomyces sp. JCM 35825]